MSAATSFLSSSSNSIQSNQDLFYSGASLLNTATSAYSSYTASSIRASMMRLQARQQDLQANQERIKGIQQSNILREQLLDNLSSVNALFAARGVDVGSRSATALATRNIAVTRGDIQQVESTAGMRSIAAKADADTLRIGAKAEKSMGRYNVARQLFGETSMRSQSSLLRGI